MLASICRGGRDDRRTATKMTGWLFMTALSLGTDECTPLRLIVVTAETHPCTFLELPAHHNYGQKMRKCTLFRSSLYPIKYQQDDLVDSLCRIITQNSGEVTPSLWVVHMHRAPSFSSLIIPSNSPYPVIHASVIVRLWSLQRWQALKHGKIYGFMGNTHVSLFRFMKQSLLLIAPIVIVSVSCYPKNECRVILWIWRYSKGSFYFSQTPMSNSNFNCLKFCNSLSPSPSEYTDMRSFSKGFF